MFFVLDRDKGPFKFMTACDDSSSQQKLRLPNRQSTTETPLHPKKKHLQKYLYSIYCIQIRAIFFSLDSVTVLTISFHLLSNLSIIHQRGQSVSCSCILAKPGKLTSVSDFTEATVGVWECCRRMYPNTAIVLDFFIFLFSTLTESVTTRPASASLQLGEHLKEE